MVESPAPTSVEPMATHTSAPAHALRPARPRRGPILAAGIVSVATVVIAFAAWRDPSTSPLVRVEDGPLLAGFAPPLLVATVAAVMALAGTAGAALAHTRPTRVGPTALTGLAAAEVVVFGLGFGSVTSIALTGYLVALAMPVVLAVLIVQAVRRYRRLRWVALALLGLFLVWGGATAALRPDTIAQLAATLAVGFRTAGRRLLVTTVVMAATVTWGLVALAELRRTKRLQRAGSVVLAHRVGLTVAAALCALPYALVRLTWLTPWPLLAPGELLTADIRL